MHPVDTPEQLLADLQQARRELQGVKAALRDATLAADTARIAILQTDAALMMELCMTIAERLWNAAPPGPNAPRTGGAAVPSTA
jgi:hypothetical protein